MLVFKYIRFVRANELANADDGFGNMIMIPSDMFWYNYHNWN
jgi:hypothetical protein